MAPEGSEEPGRSAGDGDGQDGATAAEHRPLAPVLWLTLVVVAVTPFLAGGVAGRAVSALMVGVTAFVALRRSGASRTLLRVAMASVATITVLTILTRELGGSGDRLSTISLALLCALLLITPVVVVTRLGSRPRITVDSLAGALAAYAQIGMLFAALYRLVEIVSGDPFFAGVSTSTAMDFQFFSFVTLTTLGYGNLTPAGDLGQQLAIFEALIGQVFLVTIVGLAVGNLGSAMPRRNRSRA